MNKAQSNRMRKGSIARTAAWGVGVLVLLGAAGLGVSAASGGGDTTPTGGAGLPADRTAAKKLAFDVTTTANGELEARDKIEIRNPLDQQSTITQIIPEGTWAKKGDLLVQLNTDDLQQKIDEESLRLESGNADLVAAENAYNIQINENESKLRQAQLKVALAELALRQWQEGDVRKKRQELTLAIDKAGLELERLAEKFRRSQELLQEGFISKDECDRDEVSYIEAISTYTTANLAMKVYEQYEYTKDEKTKQSDLDEAKSELERTKLNNEIELASKDAKRNNQRASVTIMKNRLEKMTKDRNAATIKAPSDGLVVYSTSLDAMRWGRSDGPLQIGQQVYPNQLLVILPDTSEMVASVRVNESLAGKVKPGQKVSVKVDAVGGAIFSGQVDSIGVMAESGGWRDPNLREYSVRVTMDAKNAGLKPAMRCEAKITLDTVPEVVTVPVQSVFNDGPVQYVYQPDGGHYIRTPVRVGRRSETLAEITSGLDSGTVVSLREPRGGEAIISPWNHDDLKKLGYRIGEDGKVLPEITAMPASAPAKAAQKDEDKANEKSDKG